MTAGRRRIADRRALSGLAHHFYWELKTLNEGIAQYVVDRKQRARFLREAETAAQFGTPPGIGRNRTGSRQSYDSTLGSATPMREGRIAPLVAKRKKRPEVPSSVHRKLASTTARRGSERLIRRPGNPEIIKDLLRATTQTEIREICSDAFTPVREQSFTGELVEVSKPNWPISGASMLPNALTQFASQFIAAKRDQRFPKSDRPTSRLRQLWFLSRVLAGATYGIQTRTAINLLGGIRPDECVDLAQLSKRSRRTSKARKKKNS